MLGSGTLLDPYIITTVDELQAMQSDLAACYKLGNNIDASATAGWNGGAGFAPVGDVVNLFSGQLDGDFKTITGLVINRPTPLGPDNVGIFGVTFSTAIVKNVNLTGFTVIGGNYTGGLVGGNYGLVEYSNYSGIIIAQTGWCAGGLVGINCGHIRRCTGGINLNTTFFGGADFLGGLVGWNYGSGITGLIEECYSAGGIITHSHNAGGLVGCNDGIVKNCYSTALTAGSGAGGLVGKLGNFVRGSVENSYSVGPVTGLTWAGGLICYSGVGVPPQVGCYYDMITSGQSDNDGRGVPKTTAEMKQQATFVGWDFATIWMINEGRDYPTFRRLASTSNSASSKIRAALELIGAL